jgi:tRNA pseudouridine38-40 synthase
LERRPRDPLASVGPMPKEGDVRRLALLVEYQGTAYGGSQLQPLAPTVQGALESALSSLTSESIRVALAGRTDAGVHASGQVASFKTASRLSVNDFERGANALLPEDIAVRAAAEVELHFDPRRHAIGRWYRYTIRSGAGRSPLRRQFVWQFPAQLDVVSMAEAAAALVGIRDFAAFTRPSEARRRETAREVQRAAVRRNGRLVLIDIEANAFLPQMVRRVAAGLAEVGSGKRSLEEFCTLVHDAKPGAAKTVAAPQGLCLMKVRYENGLFDDEEDNDL